MQANKWPGEHSADAHRGQKQVARRGRRRASSTATKEEGSESASDGGRLQVLGLDAGAAGDLAKRGALPALTHADEPRSSHGDDTPSRDSTPRSLHLGAYDRCRDRLVSASLRTFSSSAGRPSHTS